MRTSETSGRRDISGSVRGNRGRLAEPWKRWMVFVILVLLIALAWPLGEALFFYGPAFFETSVSIVYLVVIVVISAMLFSIGVYSWRREQLERERLREQLDRGQQEREQLRTQLTEYEPPIIKGFKELDLPEHIPIVERLFREYREVTLKKRFSGGHANAGVFQIGVGARRDGAPQEVDRVLKFALSRDVRAELENQELVQRRLPQRGGRIIDREFGRGDKGAVVYELEGLGDENLLNFSEFYRQIEDLDSITQIVQRLYTQVLPPFHQKTPGRLPLFEEYNRLTRKLYQIVDAVQLHPDLDRIRRTDKQVTVNIPGVGDVTLKNPLHWVHTAFRTSERAGVLKDAYEGNVHGDFHSGNILIKILKGGGRDIRVIDFADTRRGHTLDDFCRLEADIKFALTEVPEDAHRGKIEDFFQQEYEFERFLLSPTSAGQLALNALANPVQDPQFKKAWTCIEIIRSEAAQHLVGPSVYPYYLSLLHSTLPVMYYDQGQCNRWQKLYAFVSAALLCERMEQVKYL